MPRMPPRKEPKETVVYPASKRKAPPFKPQRPSQVPRIPTTESESSTTKRKPAKKATGATSFSKSIRKASLGSVEEEDESEAAKSDAASDSDEELAANPLASKSRAKATKPARPTAKSKAPQRDEDAMSKSSDEAHHSSPPRPAATDKPPAPTQLSDPTQIPQPLLIRLLHEHFVDKDTKIDKHAIQVVQKYMEVFVREAIARTAMQKREATESGDADAADAGWLELEDLEKVAPGMMLDF